MLYYACKSGKTFYNFLGFLNKHRKSAMSIFVIGSRRSKHRVSKSSTKLTKLINENSGTRVCKVGAKSLAKVEIFLHFLSAKTPTCKIPTHYPNSRFINTQARTVSHIEAKTESVTAKKCK